MMSLRRNADSEGPVTAWKTDSDGLIDTVSENPRHPEVWNFAQTKTHEMRFVIANDFRQAGLVVSTIQEVGMQWEVFAARESFRVAVALEEALSNAIVHGNLEVGSNLRERDDNAYEELIAVRLNQMPYRSRRVRIAATFTACKAVFVIRDEGPGFDTAKQTDPTDLANLARPHGRGLLLMRELVDEVRYNARGNQVTLVKHKLAVATTAMSSVESEKKDFLTESAGTR